MNFVSIDFETANRQRASVCQVGLAKVRGGRIEATDSWYVVPPTGLDSFDPFNIGVHGITSATVTAARGLSWGDSLERCADFIGDLPLIAHNSAFDRSVYEQATRHIGAAVTTRRWECTVDLSRRHLTLPNYKLPTVAAHLGLAEFDHHDATADARVCAQIALGIGTQSALRSFEELWPLRRASTEGNGRSRRFYERGYSQRKAELPQPNPAADRAHPLFGQHVVITGDLEDKTRWEVFEALAHRGATVQQNVTRKTTVLILAGLPSIPHGYALSAGTGKEKRVSELRAQGQDIALLSGSDARGLLFR
jgi:DNA polymerase III subunit epsilon